MWTRSSKLNLSFNCSLTRFAILSIASTSLCYASTAKAQFGPAPTCSASQLGGVVYRDFNNNGQRDSQEPGQIGIRVTAYDANNAVLGTSLTDINGTYRIDLSSAAQSIRVQFSELPSFVRSGPAGSQSSTSVTFASAGSCSINFGVSNPQQYCQEAPHFALPVYVNGDPLNPPAAARVVSGEGKALVEYDYNASGVNAPSLQLARNSQIGPTWGTAFQRSSNLLFVSAFQKRHVGYGPGGTGAIYKIDRSGTPTASLFVDLATLGVPTGTDPHSGLSGNAQYPSHDDASFGAVGKMSLGDMAISEDEKTLWVMNLSNRSLYSIRINLPAQTPTAADISVYPISNPGCSNDDFVPFAVTVHDGSVYVGANCTGETSQLASDLKAYVLRLNGSTFSTVFQADLSTYSKGYGIHPALAPLPDTGQLWRPWARTITDMFQTFPAYAFVEYPQPIVSNIEFDNDGSIVMNIMDRSGHQFGPNNLNVSPFDTSFVNAPSAGDILRLCQIGSGVWELENNAACPASAATAGSNNGEGPGGGEYYYEDRFYVNYNGTNIDVHQETSTGATAIRPGATHTLSIAYDINEFEDGGVLRFDNQTGAIVSKLEVYPPTGEYFGKAAGLGDLELLCDPAPVEIGNRIWRDLNGNGRQDADDPGIAGVTVRLYDAISNALLSTKVTASDGTYIFGNTDGVQPSSTYLIRLDNPSDYTSGGPLNGLVLTIPRNSDSTIDSDAELVNGFATISATAGVAGDNNHTFDAGFGQLQCTVKNLSTLNATIDGNSLGLSKLVSKALKERSTIAKKSPKLCKALSKSSQAAIKKQAQALYLKTWQNAWSYGTETKICSSPLTVCVSADISGVINQFYSDSSTLNGLVGKALNIGGCNKGTSKLKKTFLKQAKSMASKVSAAVAELQTLNPLVKCSQ
ncbi:MAG: hypothetical protein K1X79_06355 [Oligoflexia bacterium]|nr:hypothetical protein [Oligoflexia bacterium]